MIVCPQSVEHPRGSRCQRLPGQVGPAPPPPEPVPVHRARPCTPPTGPARLRHQQAKAFPPPARGPGVAALSRCGGRRPGTGAGAAAPSPSPLCGMREAPCLHHCQSNLFFSLLLHCPRRAPGALPPPPAQWGPGYRPPVPGPAQLWGPLPRALALRPSPREPGRGAGREVPAAVASPASITGGATGTGGAAVSPHGGMEPRGATVFTLRSLARPGGGRGGGLPAPLPRLPALPGLASGRGAQDRLGSSILLPVLHANCCPAIGWPGSTGASFPWQHLPEQGGGEAGGGYGVGVPIGVQGAWTHESCPGEGGR